MEANKRKWYIKRTLKAIERKELLEIQIIQKLGELKNALNQELKKLWQKLLLQTL